MDKVTPVDANGKPMEKPRADWSDVMGIRIERWMTIDEVRQHFPHADLTDIHPDDGKITSGQALMRVIKDSP